MSYDLLVSVTVYDGHVNEGLCLASASRLWAIQDLRFDTDQRSSEVVALVKTLVHFALCEARADALESLRAEKAKEGGHQ